jgi:hypothetical protein
MEPELEAVDRALLVLDVERSALESVPWITGILREGGVEGRVWEYLEASEHPDARVLVKIHDTLPARVAPACPIEAVCIAAGMETRKVLGLVMEEVFVQAGQTGRLLAAARHGEVVQAAIDMAVSPGGTQERKMILQHSGFLPVPKTSIVNVRGDHAVVGGNQQNLAVLAPVEDAIKRLSDRFGELSPPEDAEIAGNDRFDAKLITDGGVDEEDD